MREYIDKNLQPLPAGVTADEALSQMLKYRWSETYLYHANGALYLVKLADLVFEDPESPAISFATPFPAIIDINLHWSQWIHAYRNFGVEVLPAYHPQGELEALIPLQKLVMALPEWQVIEQPGALLILECDPPAYAASEIVRIAEMYNARVLSLLTHANTNSNKLVITIKINLQECAGIINTYERFGYDVINTFMHTDPDHDVYTERLESLLRTFDIK